MTSKPEPTVTSKSSTKCVSLESYFETPASPTRVVDPWPCFSASSGAESSPGGTGTSSNSNRRVGGEMEIHEMSNFSNFSCLSMRLLSLAIHKALFGLFWGTFLYSLYVDLRRRDGWYSILSDLIYLTHWNLLFQVLFTTLELASDYSPVVAERTAAFRAKFYHSICAPYSFFVAASFWSMVLFDEGLVRPSQVEDRCEEWYNQVVVSFFFYVLMFLFIFLSSSTR